MYLYRPSKTLRIAPPLHEVGLEAGLSECLRVIASVQIGLDLPDKAAVEVKKHIEAIKRSDPQLIPARLRASLQQWRQALSTKMARDIGLLLHVSA